MKRPGLAVAALTALCASAALAQAPAKSVGKWTKAALEGKELYATLRTSEGEIVARLFSKDAPKTVANFVGLAAGEKEWTHPTTGVTSKKPLYDGTVFHRVIPQFMIQGGDPLGAGVGGPGYKFEDELNSGRGFDKPGLLAMANSGPNTNGSQFFITVKETPWLNGLHTLFGEVVSGYDVAVKISQVSKDAQDKPTKAVVVRTIEISDKAPKGVKVEQPKKTAAAPAAQQ